MGSKSNTSSLFSTYKSSKLDRNYSTNETSRYIVGSVGKSCGKHVKINAGSCKNHGQNPEQRHKNVAIATQVINPSAIGGSLKTRRFVEHFGPRDDDEVSFLSHKGHKVWGKVCYYGISIGVTVLMMTGLIVAVGYMQSEKERITSRPVKLAQGQKFVFKASTTQLPPSILEATTTTRKSVAKYRTDDDDDIDEIGIGDYTNEEELQNLDTLRSHQGIFHGLKDLTESPSETENSISDEYTIDKGNSNTDTETDSDTASEDLNSDEEDTSNLNIEGGEDHKSFSEVRVLPPPNFAFEGISFGFPIYRTNSKNSSSVDSVDKDANTNTDTTESSSTVEPISEAEETKELETSIINQSNFTSLIDSEENSEHEKVLSDHSEENVEKENYANTSQKSQSEESLSFKEPAPSKTSDSLSLPTNSEDSSYNTHSHSETKSKPNRFNYNSQTDSDSSHQLNEDNANNIILKSSSGINTIAPFDNENNVDFNIATTPVAKLQTDIFDNDEKEDFETSASEENGVDTQTIRNRPRPNNVNKKDKTPRLKDHGNLNSNNGRRGKLLRPSQSDDYVDEESIRHDPRKLSLKPNSYRRFRVYGNRGNGGGSGGRDKGKSPNQQEEDSSVTTFSNGQTSITMPILEYKADFDKLSPLTPTPETPLEKVDFQSQPHNPHSIGNSSPYPDFKFKSDTLSTDDADKPFNLKEYLDKYANKNVNNVGSSPGDVTNTNNANPDFALEHIKNQLKQFKLDTSGSSSYSIGTTAAFTDTSGALGLNYQQDSPAQLSPQPTSGAFGSASSTGATLNLFQFPAQQQTYNFDATASNPVGSFNLPSGTVPVDLSSSHIPVNGISGQSQSQSNGFTIDANGHFSLTNPSNLPYPNISPSENYGNAFSFATQNTDQTNSGGYGYGSSNKDIVLTTGGGQIPNYNTITQGIHLLTLLSGKTPNSFQSNSYDSDQLSSGSSLYPTGLEFSSKPEFPTPGFTGYGSGGSSNNFLQGVENNWKNIGGIGTVSDSDNSVSGSITFPTYADNLYPQKNFKPFEFQGAGDQDSSASFSKSIVQKVPDITKNLQGFGSPASTTEASVFRLLLSSVNKGIEKRGEPKSLSISILPKAKSTQSPESSFLGHGKSSESSKLPKPIDSSTEMESHTPQSRKRLLQPASDMEIAESKIERVTIPIGNSRRGRKLSLSQGNRSEKHGEQARGLRSGFFV